MTGFVYFIQAGADGPIKVGFTARSPYRRLANLQTACAQPLRVMGVVHATVAEEKKLHGQLRSHRLQGEWFAPHEETLAAIDKALSDYPHCDVPPPRARATNQVQDIIDILDGLRAVARLTRSKYTTVANWKARNGFPPRTYVALTSALRERGYEAPPSLWSMIPALKHEAAE